MRLRFSLEYNQKGEKPDYQTRSNLWHIIFFLATVLMFLATIWVVAGSIIYPLWWFEFFFKGGAINWRLYGYGFRYLLNSVPWLLFALPTLALGLAFTIWKLWVRARQFFDRCGVYTLACCIIAISTNAYWLNRTQRIKYEIYSQLLKIEDSMTQLVIALAELGLPPAQVIPPVDFLYVDKDRIDMLYGQVGSVLSERKRTVALESKNNRSFDLERKPISLRWAGSTERLETREYKSVDPSTSRECLELMNGLLARQVPPYYRTFEQLSSFQILTEVKETMKSLRESLPNRSLFTDKVPDRNTATLKQMTEIRRKMSPASVEDLIRTELRELSGLIIVQGDLKRVSLRSGVGEFSEIFKSTPRPIYFHFVLRDEGALRVLPSRGKRLVLADVIKKWDGGPQIEKYPSEQPQG